MTPLGDPPICDIPKYSSLAHLIQGVTCPHDSFVNLSALLLPSLFSEFGQCGVPMQACVEIHEDHPSEKSEELLVARSRPPALRFGRNLTVERGLGKLYGGERDGFWCSLIGCYCPGEARMLPTGSGASYLID